jgi:molecular chaperone GrpE
MEAMMTKKHHHEQEVIINEESAAPLSEAEKLVNLELKLAALEQEKQAEEERTLRLQADFENFRRRSREENTQAGLSATEDLLRNILPVIDNLERAIATIPENGGAGWREGVELTLKHFLGLLAAEGLETIASVGLPFNPQFHEAVMQEESEEASEPAVLAEMQKGYTYRGKLLRPAMVKVAVPKE